MAEEDLQTFSNFDEYMRDKDVNQQVIIIVQQHLQSLTESFGHYYPKEEDPRHSNMWIHLQQTLKMAEKESLINLSSDDILKAKFQSSLSRHNFWFSIKSKYSPLSKKAMKIFI